MSDIREASQMTTIDYLTLMVKSWLSGIKKVWKKTLIRMLIIYLILWVINVWLIAGPNGGFWLNKYNRFWPITAARDHESMATLFWMIFMFFLSSTFGRIRQDGLNQFVLDMIAGPAQAVSDFNSGNKVDRMFFLGSMVAFLGLGLFVNNPYLALVYSLIAYTSFTLQGRSMLIVLCRLGSNDVKRLIKRDSAESEYGYSLMLMGISIAFLLTWALQGRWYNNIIVMLLLVILMILLNNGTIKSDKAMMIIGFVLFTAVVNRLSGSNVYADDGGAAEAGGWRNWPGSSGAGPTVEMGAGPAASGAAGAGVGSLVTSGDGPIISGTDHSSQSGSAASGKGPKKIKSQDLIDAYRSTDDPKIRKKIRSYMDKDTKMQVLREEQRRYAGDAHRANTAADIYGGLATGTGFIRDSADVTVDILAEATGPGGRVVKGVKDFGINFGESVGSAYANDTSMTDAALKGSAKGLMAVGNSQISNPAIKATSTVVTGGFKNIIDKGATLDNYTDGLKQGAVSAVTDIAVSKIPGFKANNHDGIKGIDGSTVQIKFKDNAKKTGSQFVDMMTSASKSNKASITKTAFANVALDKTAGKIAGKGVDAMNASISNKPAVNNTREMLNTYHKPIPPGKI